MAPHGPRVRLPASPPPSSNNSLASRRLALPPSSHAKRAALLGRHRIGHRIAGHDDVLLVHGRRCRRLLGVDLPWRAGRGRSRRRRVLVAGQAAARRQQAVAGAAAALCDGRAAPGVRAPRHGARVARLPPRAIRRLGVERRHQRGAPRGSGSGGAAIRQQQQQQGGAVGAGRPPPRPRAAGAEAQGPPRGGDRRRRIRGEPPGGPPPCARRQRDRGGQPLHRPERERAPPRREPAVRDDPARRGGAHPAGGGPDLPPGVPGVARALQAQPRQDHQDQRRRHAQHAGTRQARRRALPPHQHQRGLRRPAPAPPGRDILGERQPDRCSELLRRREADGGDAHHGLPPRRQPRGSDCSDLQHLRAAHVHRRRPRRQQLRRSGAEEGAPNGVRRRQADEELPVRLRSGRGPDEADGGRARGALQPGEPRRVHHAGAGQGGARHHRPQRAHRVPPQHRRRPAQAQARHHPRQGPAGMGAQDPAHQGPTPHGPGLPQPHLRGPAEQGRQRRRQLMIYDPSLSFSVVPIAREGSS